MKRISIGSWNFNIGPYAEHPVPFDDVLQQLQQLGFDGIELGGFNSYPNPDNTPTKEDRAALVEKLSGYGLTFSGLAADLWSQKLINTDDQSAYINEFTKNADFARDLGIGGVRVDTVQPPTIFDEVDYDTAFNRVVNTWKTCADIAADRGLYMTWEFEPGFAFNKPSEILRIHEAINKPNFGILYDTCHGQMVGVIGARQPGEKETFENQIEFIEMLSGRINHIHLIDSDNTCHKDANGNDETSAHPPFGVGILNFDEILPVLTKENVGHDWWTIDLCFWHDAWAATATCKTAIDEMNAKYGN
jgi:sugar phosphate isomerase/epimerase